MAGIPKIRTKRLPWVCSSSPAFSSMMTKTNKEKEYEGKPKYGNKGGENRRQRKRRKSQAFKRAVPSAEKKQRSDAGGGEHVGIFGHEEHGELHGTVFGMVSGHQFGLGL